MLAVSSSLPEPHGGNLNSSRVGRCCATINMKFHLSLLTVHVNFSKTFPLNLP
jgi:hypothetical protein